MTIDRSTLSPIKILEKYVFPHVAFEPNSGCWLWMGHIGKDDRATVRLPLLQERGWSTNSVSRYIFQHFIGEISPGFWLVPSCRCKGCVNPVHHSATSQKEIMRESGACSRYANRTACSKGHPYTPKNTQIRKSGSRVCRTCNRVRVARDYRENRNGALRAAGLSENFELSQSLLPRPRKYYVYHLIDPATKEVFYVGKGCGNRALHHEKNAIENARLNPDKEARIRMILSEGLQLRIVIIRRGLAEDHAFRLEKQEIERIGIDRLTNRACGITPATTTLRQQYGMSA